MKLFINQKECKTKKDFLDTLKGVNEEFHFVFFNDNDEVLFECKINKETIHDIICEFEKQIKTALQFEIDEDERKNLLGIASFYLINFKEYDKKKLSNEDDEIEIIDIDSFLTKEDYLEMAYLCALYDQENGDYDKSLDSLEKEYYSISRLDLIEKYSLKYPSSDLYKEAKNTELTLSTIKPLELRLK